MNPVVKIIDQILIQINRLLDSIDHRTVETIRNSFYLLVAVLVVICILIGINYGKNAARRSGQPLTESTTDLFELSVRKERGKKEYRSLIETDMSGDYKSMNLNKTEFPDKVNTTSEIDDKLAETKIFHDNKKSLQLETDKLADMTQDKKTDSDTDYKKPDIKKADNNTEQKTNTLKPIYDNSDLIE